MELETKTCQNCKSEFVIEPNDFSFYEKMHVPPPTWCPECRFVRRLVWRNERTLYKRPCDLCGEDKILTFPKGSPFTAYCHECWISDQWDGASYAREYDFGRPFFEQFKDLLRAVPRPGIIKQGYIVESEYVNRTSDLKNCYLIFASAGNENCFYGVDFWDAKDSMDCYDLKKSEKCYGCIDCYNSNNLRYAQECVSCTDSAFLLNCRNCTNCFGCVNLRNKSYCIWNRQYSREGYATEVQKYNLRSAAGVAAAAAEFQKLADAALVPALIEYHSTGVTGNWLEECKNVRDGFNCNKVEEGRYLFGIMEAKDVMDYTYWGKSSELIYESSNIGRQCASVSFSNECWDQLIRAQYCMNCHGSSDLFGCVGLKKQQYCILNKQYTKESFDKLRTKIVEHMNERPYRDAKGSDYRYGEFYPPELSPFAYNETIAQEYTPLSKEEALAAGFCWREPDGKSYTATLRAEDVPDSIADAGDPILGQVIGCAHGGTCNDQCATAFRVVRDELSFYRAMGVPLPHLCPNCRHYERLRRRNPIALWERRCQCAGTRSTTGSYNNTAAHVHGTEPCPVVFKTSYAPDRPEIVYCVSCYNAEVV